MEQPIIILQCSNENQVTTLCFVLYSLGYIWAGSRKSLIEFTPYSLKRRYAGRNTNIIIRPYEKDVKYNFSKYEGLGNIDGVNYVLKVIE